MFALRFILFVFTSATGFGCYFVACIFYFVTCLGFIYIMLKIQNRIALRQLKGKKFVNPSDRLMQPIVRLERLQVDPYRCRILPPNGRYVRTAGVPILQKIAGGTDLESRSTRSQMKRDQQLFDLLPKVKLEPLDLKRVLSETTCSPRRRLSPPRKLRKPAEQPPTPPRQKRSNGVQTTSEKVVTKDKAATSSVSPRVTRSYKKRGVWSEEEFVRLKKAVDEISTAEPDYWKSVAVVVRTRDADECFTTFNSNPNLQKSVHRKKVFSSVFSSETSRPPKEDPPVAAPQVTTKPKEQKVGRVVTARAGTLKRRQQIRHIVQEDAAKDWQEDDQLSVHGGGLTQSEREALLGNVTLSPSASQRGNMSVITAGGVALSVGGDDSGNASVVSSAFEMPKTAERNIADKLVKKLRSPAVKAKSKSKTSNGTSKKTPFSLKVVSLDRLQPLSIRLAAATSTPLLAVASRGDDDDESTLAATNSSVSEDD